jgi:subtilisin family serine protease
MLASMFRSMSWIQVSARRMIFSEVARVISGDSDPMTCPLTLVVLWLISAGMAHSKLAISRARLSSLDKADSNEHSVAGIIGAEMYGVAPHATLVNVKVIDDLGKPASPQMIAHAIHDITIEHNKNKEKSMKDPDSLEFRGSVINMSFGWVGSGSLLVNALIDANDTGISLYVAAGNQNEGYDDQYPCASRVASNQPTSNLGI